MKKTLKENLKKITALLLVVSMATSFDLSVFAWDADANASETDVENTSSLTEEDNFVVEGINGAGSDTLDGMTDDEKKAEEACEKECMWGDHFSEKLLTYLCLKYQDIGIDINDVSNNKDKIATQMANQVSYSTIEIDGDDTFDDRGYQNLTDNMVQFKFLGNFGESIGCDEKGERVYPDTVKTLIIKNVDEIRNLNVPASVETLIIENTTFNCYRYYKDSPGIQAGMNPGDLRYCENLKKLVLKNVKFGDNYKRGDAAKLLLDCPYETDYRLNLMNCPNLEELEIDVNFDGAEEVQLAIDGGFDNQFSKLTDDKCKISPAPGTGSGQLTLICNPNSYLAKRYNSSAAVEFKNPTLRTWLLGAGYDTNHDGIISQAEMDSIETLTINNQTARSVVQHGLDDFMELADIEKMHGLKTLELDYYDPSDSSDNPGHSLKGIDFPQSLENLSMKNIYWSKGSETKTHDNVNIILNNLKTLKLHNTNVDLGTFDYPEIVLTDTKGVLESCIIEKTDVKSIKLINTSEEEGVDKENDEKQRIRFSAPECKKLESVEFLGEGYAVEGSLDLTNDENLKHIGVPTGTFNEDKSKCSQWTVFGEFDMTGAPVNITLNSCTNLGKDCNKKDCNEKDCNETVIDYDFVGGKHLNVQTMNTGFDEYHKLTIKRNPRKADEKAGTVYLTCDKDGWIYDNYTGQDGFVIEDKSSFPTIAVFSEGQRIRTSGEGHNSDNKFTEDTERWVERWDLVMSPKGYANNFGNLTFYVVDKVPDGGSNTIESLRRVFYDGPVYAEWEQQGYTDSIIKLWPDNISPKPVPHETGGYKLENTLLKSTGTPGEVKLSLYVLKEENGSTVKSYIGYQDIKIYKMPDSVELVNDGTEFGSGTKEDPFIIYKDEELKLKARPLVKNGDSLEVDRSGDYALRDIYWRIKEYDETSKITSDSDGYSLYTLDSATKAGISVVREDLEPGDNEAEYDKRRDNAYYNHRRFTFDTAGTKYKIVAQVPYKNNDAVITKEVFVEFHSKPLSIDVSNDIIHGKKDYDEAAITINNVYNVNSVSVIIKNPELYDDCFTVERDSSSIDGKEVWKLRISNSDNVKVKNIINSTNGSITLVINADGKEYEKTIGISSVYSDSDTPGNDKFWCSEIEDQIYTGKAIKPKINIYYGTRVLEEGKDYTLSYSNNVKAASKSAVDTKGKRIGPSVTIKGKGNYSDKHVYYFTIRPCSIENKATVDDIFEAKKNTGIKITPTVLLDGIKLKQGRDYVVSTTTDEKDAIVSLKEPKEYPLYVVGKGNYTGAIPFNFTITTSLLAGKTKIKKIANQKYDGYLIQPAVGITYKGKDVTDCFDVKYENNIEIGKATVIVTAKKTDSGDAFTGKAGYSFAGYKKSNFKIVGTSITSAKLGAKIEPATYSGAKYEPDLKVYVGTTPLSNNVDYTITYKNNINAGKATAIIKGIGKYSGTKKIKFKINKYDAGKDSLGIVSVSGNNPISVAYEKGGARPKPEVAMNGAILTENKDYILKYSQNNAVADSTAAVAPNVTVVFKGNFSGKKSIPFTITAKDIALCKISIADKPVSTKAGEWKQAVATIVDTNGKKLVAGTDYNKNFEFYSNPECTSVITEETLAANTTVYVKVTGVKNYAGSYAVGRYRISKINISTAKATIGDKEYTGTAICPTAEDITVKAKNSNTQLTPFVDYEVVAGSYTNNTNKGTASVTIRGIGDYYGTRVVKYRIKVNKILWWNW